MSDIPSHTSPPYSDNACEDALFHYTTAAGLIGILQSKEVWATAYYCSNDSSELYVGRGVLRARFYALTHKMILEGAPLMRTFAGRGVDPTEYAENFEQLVIGTAFSQLSTYMTCFCKPDGKENFQHGLLSQWRGYGLDGGYALQFSRKKLLAAIENLEEEKKWQYELRDVFYSADNPLKEKVLDHIDSFVQSYTDFLERLGKPDVFAERTMPSPIRGLAGGPLESLLNYLIHTKNSHFSEERECRLSLVELEGGNKTLPTYCFDRGGLVVPYKRIPRSSIPLVDCIEWILIGPNSRMRDRFKSVCQLVKGSGLNINVRPSHIPFVRN